MPKFLRKISRKEKRVLGSLFFVLFAALVPMTVYFVTTDVNFDERGHAIEVSSALQGAIDQGDKYGVGSSSFSNAMSGSSSGSSGSSSISWANSDGTLKNPNSSASLIEQSSWLKNAEQKAKETLSNVFGYGGSSNNVGNVSDGGGTSERSIIVDGSKDDYAEWLKRYEFLEKGPYLDSLMEHIKIGLEKGYVNSEGKIIDRGGYEAWEKNHQYLLNKQGTNSASPDQISDHLNLGIEKGYITKDGESALQSGKSFGFELSNELGTVRVEVKRHLDEGVKNGYINYDVEGNVKFNYSTEKQDAKERAEVLKWLQVYNDLRDSQLKVFGGMFDTEGKYSDSKGTSISSSRAITGILKAGKLGVDFKDSVQSPKDYYYSLSIGGGEIPEGPSCGSLSGMLFFTFIDEWPVGTFCTEGASDPLSPVFPGEGSFSTWNCVKGNEVVGCSAGRYFATYCSRNSDCKLGEVCFEGGLACIKGDILGDGEIRLNDFAEFKKDFSKFKENGWSDGLSRSDLNEDKKISMADFSIFVNSYRLSNGLFFPK